MKIYGHLQSSMHISKFGSGMELAQIYTSFLKVF